MDKLKVYMLGKGSVTLGESIEAFLSKYKEAASFSHTPDGNKARVGHCVHGVVDRLKIINDPFLPHGVKLYDMKLLHLLTHYNPANRTKLRDDLYGLTYLVEALNFLLQPDNNPIKSLDSLQASLCIEILKILFNLTIIEGTLDQDKETQFMKLVGVLRGLLVCPIQSSDLRDQLHNHIVQLLTAVPNKNLRELLISAEVKISYCIGCRDSEYKDMNMDAVIVLLDFLKIQLVKLKAKKASKETICPFLYSFCRMCRSSRIIRDFCRMMILSNSEDGAERLSENGDPLRNRLYNLFSNPCEEIKILSVNFFYILCKKNRSLFMKYTGEDSVELLDEMNLIVCRSSSSQSTIFDEVEDESKWSKKSKLKPLQLSVAARRPPIAISVFDFVLMQNIKNSFTNFV
ncbi:hypothetical protein HELRODRAFT_178141 [Helobdella robusta]|uniref:Timeless N-terminal domain-containing protein n=1 Tax=Helobdella robusta TaxID=6412 RepID=T1FCT9_HELRO|nr:hypothetical protein HELRODRAFT_178141 [Helobdella robusta]ESN97355.1 hypothetical protein HELRODRAFT_178141 [Helobdella robusta]